MIQYERLVAPDEHLGLLFEPPAAEALRQLTAGPPPDSGRAPLLDSTIGELRQSLRARLNIRGPLVVVGHQPEFFHAGVLAKLIAGSLLAEVASGQCLYVSADTDVPKSAVLPVPVQSAGKLQRYGVPIPGTQMFLPEEYRADVPSNTWRQFFAEIAVRSGPANGSFLAEYEQAFCSSGRDEISFVDATWRGLAAVQQALKLPVAQHVRMSGLSETPEFRAFFLAIAADAERFARAYNDALAAFRIRHRVHNPARPAPDLSLQDGRIELPFWVDRPDQARRRLFVDTHAADVSIWADDERIDRLPRGVAMKNLDRPLLAQWHIRPRALTLSAFLRLFVGDLFIHGIGGAKYDEATAAFVREFWNVQPCPLACVSATVRLPLTVSSVSRHDLARARWRSRDFRYNPQRYVTDLDPALRRQRAALVARSDELRRINPRDRAQRRKVFHEIQQLRHEMVERHASDLAAIQHAEHELEWQIEQDAIARDREYFFALQPLATLADLTEKIRRSLR